MSWIPEIGDRAFHKSQGVFTVIGRFRMKEVVFLSGLADGSPAKLTDCYPDRSQELLNPEELETLVSMIQATLKAKNVGDSDLLTLLTPEQKDQVWAALTPKEQVSLIKLRKAKVAA